MQRPGTRKRVTLTVALLLDGSGRHGGRCHGRSPRMSSPLGSPAHSTKWARPTTADGTRPSISSMACRRLVDYCVEQWMGTSDPRFTGTYTRFVNVDEYGDEDVVPAGVSLWVSTVTHRVENEGGVWHGEATVGMTVDDIPRRWARSPSRPQTIVFRGSGDTRA